MGDITIRPVTKENWYACTQLSVTEEQKALFPASVVYWLAESKFEPSFLPLSIYAGEVLIGFSTIGIEPDTGLMWIVAFLIDQHFQGKGFGRRALCALITYIKEHFSVSSITIGHRPENYIAQKLYASCGFDIINVTEREILRRLSVEDAASLKSH
jgi:RimJ/RimL family protein N-acetyltransferase